MEIEAVTEVEVAKFAIFLFATGAFWFLAYLLRLTWKERREIERRKRADHELVTSIVKDWGRPSRNTIRGRSDVNDRFEHHHHHVHHHHHHCHKCRTPAGHLGLLYIVGQETISMSQNIKNGQTAHIVATFVDNTQTPPVSLPLSALPVFQNPEGNLTLGAVTQPDPTQGIYNVDATWSASGAAGQTATVKCHGEGEADGSDPIDCPDIQFNLLAPDDNAGSMTATVS